MTNTKTAAPPDHGCSCNDPRCRYDELNGNPLRTNPPQAAAPPQADSEGLREAGPLPEPLWDVSAQWYSLCERAPHATKMSITGELAEAIVKTVVALAASPAIAPAGCDALDRLSRWAALPNHHWADSIQLSLDEVRAILAALPVAGNAGTVDAETLRWCEDVEAALREAGGSTNNMRAVAIRRVIAALTPAAPQDGAATLSAVGSDPWPDNAIDAAVLVGQLKDYAEPACDGCDGSGVFYGNVCVCNCILDALPKQTPADQPAADDYGPATHFVDGLGWVVACSDAAYYVRRQAQEAVK